MASEWGRFLRMQIFGESHGPGLGVVLDGLPPGEEVEITELQNFLRRRAPGQGKYATSRQEDDVPEFLSGLLEGRTTGSPLMALLRNRDTRSQDYAALRDVPRPGHADFSAEKRFRGAQDVRGGGHFSGRLTAALTLAGGIAKQILARRGIYIGAHLASVGIVRDRDFNPVQLTVAELLAPGQAAFPVIDPAAGSAMQQAIQDALEQQDSLGGRIEAAALGVPPGWGSPIFAGVENRVAEILFGIPAVRGVEFGYGMAAAELRGSQHNDEYFITAEGEVRTVSNNHGGILGGITTGMPIIVKIAIKPTPSIAREQNSISLRDKAPARLAVRGRHDPCIAPRAVPVAEAALALALLDLALEAKTYQL